MNLAGAPINNDAMQQSIDMLLFLNGVCTVSYSPREMYQDIQQSHTAKMQKGQRNLARQISSRDSTPFCRRRRDAPQAERGLVVTTVYSAKNAAESTFSSSRLADIEKNSNMEGLNISGKTYFSPLLRGVFEEEEVVYIGLKTMTVRVAAKKLAGRGVATLAPRASAAAIVRPAVVACCQQQQKRTFFSKERSKSVYEHGAHRSDAEAKIAEVPVVQVEGSVALCDGGESRECLDIWLQCYRSWLRYLGFCWSDVCCVLSLYFAKEHVRAIDDTGMIHYEYYYQCMVLQTTINSDWLYCCCCLYLSLEL